MIEIVYIYLVLAGNNIVLAAIARPYQFGCDPLLIQDRCVGSSSCDIPIFRINAEL